MAEAVPRLGESAVVRSLRRLRDRYFPKTRAVTPATEADRGHALPGFLESLPRRNKIHRTGLYSASIQSGLWSVIQAAEVESNVALIQPLGRQKVSVQFVVMTYLSPADLCLLGATCHYWRGMVRDPLLWRFFLLRDMPYWTSVDHFSMPRLELLDAPLIDESRSLDDREEGADIECKVDYMAEYLRGSPLCRQQWLPSLAPYRVLTSFLHSLVASEEPCFAMFGPGMEQLDVSFVTRLMYAPDVLPVTGMPYRQISGIGSGISYLFNNQHKFNILTLYSTNKAERDRARAEQRNVNNKLFTVEVDAESGVETYSPAPHVQQVCQVVNGFIYVANAERDDGECEAAQIQAVLSSAWGSTSRPLLVLSCVSRDNRESVHSSVHPITKRVPSVYVANRLELIKLENPWMVQDVEVESLSGLLDGISWLLRCSGVKLQYG